MTRVLKSLGLALAAMAALVAMMAPAAQAETGALTAPLFPAIVTGNQQPGPTFDIGEGPLKQVGCGVSRLDSTLLGPTDPVTFQPTYLNCIAEPGAMPVTITLNGCDYSIGFTRPGTTGWPEGTGTMQASINCPPEQQIEIHVYENAMRHAENVSLCTYDIRPQGPVPAGVYHNRVGMPNDVEATVQANFTAQSTIGPAAICGGNAFNQHLPIRLTGTYTLRAFEDINGVEGAPIPLDVG
ncbi:MAG TPA: hypothetical protein VFY69_00795 [Solirubrobacterales bacterium]|nr:hypothetical protein [Solirubrobacterales bacterium]